MITAIKRTVTAGQNGAVHIDETALRPGTKVEVIVLVSDEDAANISEPAGFLETLAELSLAVPPMPEDFSERFEDYLYPEPGERRDG